MSFGKQLQNYLDELDALENPCAGGESSFRLDQLESRVLYSADPTSSATPANDPGTDVSLTHDLVDPLPQYQNPQTIDIAFHPAGSTGPDGYLLDSGAVFGTRAGGLSYGWDVDNSTHIFDRNSTVSFSERYDGVAQMQPGGQNRTWKIAVPNGLYNVRVVAGDALSGQHTIVLDVDGKTVIRGNTDPYTNWLDGTVTINVTDGYITVANAAGAKNNTLNFIQITPTTAADRVVSAMTIASGNDPATRNVDPTDFANGWTGFVKNQLQPEVAEGYKRFIIHNPFGTTGPSRMMDLGEYLEAKDAGLTWLTDDFSQALRQLTSSGVEVIVYLGNDVNDPEFSRLAASGDIAGWNQRFWSAVQPLIDAGASIGLDAAVLTPQNDPLYSAVQELRAMDMKVYVEARPSTQMPWWNNFPVISIESWWQQSDPQKIANNWAFTNDQVTGEVIRWVMGPPNGMKWMQPGWMAPGAERILQDGDTAAIGAGFMSQIDQVSLQWLLAHSTPPAASPVPQSGGAQAVFAGPVALPTVTTSKTTNASQVQSITGLEGFMGPLASYHYLVMPTGSAVTDPKALQGDLGEGFSGQRLIYDLFRRSPT